MKWGQIGLWALGLLAWAAMASADEVPGEQMTDAAQNAGEASPLPAEQLAKEHFRRGREAFDAAEYEDALHWFWEAYGVSQLGELQYNIGLTANRLQRDEEALEAFRRYLKEAKEAGRRTEVERRVAALERSIAVREASTAALEDAEMRYETLAKKAADDRATAERKRRIALLGGSMLLAGGAVGLGAMTWGLVKDGGCDERVGEAEACVGEESTTTWAWVYGGLGAAAMVGGITWLVVGGKRVDERATEISFSPMGVSVRGRF